MFARLAPTLALLAACDQVYGLDGRGDPVDATPSDADDTDGALVVCQTEAFDGNFDDIAPRWDRYEGMATVQAKVDVDSSALRWVLPRSILAPNYAGIIRNSDIDFTGASMQAEIVDATTRPASFELFFKLFSSANSNNYYQAILEGSMMRLIRSVGGVTEGSTSFTFDPVMHRHWRVRHLPAVGRVILETSEDNLTFVQRAALIADDVAVDQFRLEIGSGTYGVQAADLAPVVDNFAFCPAS